MTYDFSASNIIMQSKDHLNTFVTDEEIMLHYFGEFEPGGFYYSPFRHETSPSFNVYYDKYHQLKWKDWGSIDTTKNPIEYVAKIYGIHFYQALNRIYEELILQHKSSVSKIALDKVRELKESVIDYSKGIEIRDYWEDFELEYWKQLAATEKILSYFKILPCTGLWFNGKRWHSSKPGDPLFVYLYNRDIPSWKAYRPYSKNKDDRFKSNKISGHIQGMNQLPKTGKVLMITSSQKDRIPWLHAGIHSIAPHNENIVLGEEIMYDLKQRFKYVIIGMNNDPTGLNANAEYSGKYEIGTWNVPLRYEKATDPSDLWINYGKTAFFNHAASIIKLNRE